MAFDPLSNRIPTSIGMLQVELQDPDGTPGNRKARYHLVILDQEGVAIRAYSGDLQPHLEPGMITDLTNFLDALRLKAETDILP